jgi:hypothetical protein
MNKIFAAFGALSSSEMFLCTVQPTGPRKGGLSTLPLSLWVPRFWPICTNTSLSFSSRTLYGPSKRGLKEGPAACRTQQKPEEMVGGELPPGFSGIGSGRIRILRSLEENKGPGSGSGSRIGSGLDSDSGSNHYCI